MGEVGFFDDRVGKFDAIDFQKFSEAGRSRIDAVIVFGVVVVKVVQIKGDLAVGGFAQKGSDDGGAGLLVTQHEDGVVTNPLATAGHYALGIDTSHLQAVLYSLDWVFHERLEFACDHGSRPVLTEQIEPLVSCDKSSGRIAKAINQRKPLQPLQVISSDPFASSGIADCPLQHISMPGNCHWQWAGHRGTICQEFEDEEFPASQV